MPAVNVSFESAVRSAGAERPPQTAVVATALGLALVEIQGELSIPREKPAGLSVSEQELFTRVPLPAVYRDGSGTGEADVEDVDAVKFGRLELDDSLKTATLFISTTQRLVGTVEKIDPPLGVLRVVHSTNTDTDPDDPGASDTASSGGKKCEVLDIVSTKIVFRHRPLPIM